MRVVEGRLAVDDVDALVSALGTIGEAHGCAVQAFDARYVAGRRHLEAAVDCATRAAERGDTIADDRAVEILCYAAGRRQIERALTMGVPDDGGPVVVAIDGDDETGAAAAVRDLVAPGDVLGAGRDEGAIREFFGIADAEVGATDASLEALVIERVVLLTVEK